MQTLNKPRNRSLKQLFAKLKDKAKVRNIKITLTFKQFCKLREKTCRYCNNILPEAGYGVDRLNNKLGYTVKNSVPCCSKCNKAKMEMSERDFMCHIEAIYKTAKKRGTL